MKSLRLISAVLFLSAFAAAQTGALAPVPIQQPLSNPGLILPGACLYIFAAGTTTPATTYSDSTLMTPNTNPIVLNSSGRAPAIYMTNSLKMVLANKSLGVCPGSPGTVIWSQDNVYDAGLALRTALAAASGASLVGFQQVNGTATTVQAALRNCPFDTEYTTFAIATANIPANGCITVIGSPILTSGITLSVPNVTIQCAPGALIKAGASNFKMFTLAASNISIQGCTFDGGSGSSFANNYGIYFAGQSNISIKNNIFQNFSSSDFQTILMTYSGSTSSCNVEIDSNHSLSSPGGEFFHAFSPSAASPTVPCGLKFTNNEITGFKTGFEIQAGTLTKCDIGGNYIHDPTGSSGYLMGTVSVLANSYPTPVGGPPYGCQVHDNNIVVSTANAQNYAQNPATTSQSGYFEIFSTGAQVYANNFDRVALSLGGPNQRVTGNTSNFVFGNGPAIGSNGNYPSNNTVVTGNWIVEPQVGGIGINMGGNPGGGGTIVGDNILVRTPGSWTTDNAAPQNWYGIADSTNDAKNPTIIRDNQVYYLGSAADQLILCGVAESIAQTGRIIKNLIVNNTNATAQGNALCDFGSSSYTGSSISGLRALNVANIVNGGGNIGGLLSYSDNLSLIGNGSGSPPVNNIINLIAYANLGTPGTVGQATSCTNCATDAGGYVIGASALGSPVATTVTWNGTSWVGLKGFNDSAPTCANASHVTTCTVAAGSSNSSGSIALTTDGGGVAQAAWTWVTHQSKSTYGCSFFGSPTGGTPVFTPLGTSGNTTTGMTLTVSGAAPSLSAVTYFYSCSEN